MSVTLAVATVVVADGNPFLRHLLDTVCARHGLRVVGEVTRGQDLVALCEEVRPDVVVSDCHLEDGPLEDWLDEVLMSGARLVVLCDDASPERLTQLLELGASGYLLYDSAPEQVGEALLAVASGAAVLAPVATATILEQWRRLRSEDGDTNSGLRSNLTPRELDVLEAMSDGLATKAIANRLGVATKTVENHKVRIFDKLGVRTQAQAVSLAIGHGLLSRPPDLLEAGD
jgi:DNA-binding NarL/FixJ family response regulator